MVRDSTFEELFGGFGVALDALTLTQSQIKQFVVKQVKHNGDWLKKGGDGTFFSVQSWQRIFCACSVLLLGRSSWCSPAQPQS
jgi:hypothetical protein